MLLFFFYQKKITVSVSKISNDLGMYLPRYFVFEECLQPDLYYMASQILLIFIDFTQDRAVPCTIFFDRFSNISALKASELEETITNSKWQSLRFKGLPGRTIIILR